MHTIERANLTTVIGGCQCQQQPPQSQPQAPEQAAPTAPGGDVMGGAQQLLGFFQSDGFKQLLGGLQSLVGQAAQK